MASGQDQDIHLRTRGSTATLHPDGTLVFSHEVPLVFSHEVPLAHPGPGPQPRSTTIPAHDTQSFDALFPPDRPNKRNITRRLYELGL